jgi:hypothetical protein
MGLQEGLALPTHTTWARLGSNLLDLIIICFGRTMKSMSESERIALTITEGEMESMAHFVRNKILLHRAMGFGHGRIPLFNNINGISWMSTSCNNLTLYTNKNEQWIGTGTTRGCRFSRSKSRFRADARTRTSFVCGGWYTWIE